MSPNSLQPELLKLSEHVINTCAPFERISRSCESVFWQQSYESDVTLGVEADIDSKRRRPMVVNAAWLRVGEEGTVVIAYVDRQTAQTARVPRDAMGAYVLEMFAKYYEPPSADEEATLLIDEAVYARLSPSIESGIHGRGRVVRVID